MNSHLISTAAKMTLKSHLSLFISAALIAPSAFGAEPPFAPQSTGLPVTLSLAKPGYVTAVIERADGRRVFNLASEVKAQAGPLTFNWANIANLSSATTTITMQASNVSITATQRPRYMALTDITGDPDDQQSLVRFMVYANDIEIVGILLAPFGSMSGAESATHSVISGYEQVRSNLLLHDDRYPTADYLRSVVKKHRSYPDGHGDFGQGAGVWQDHVGAGKSTEASNFLIQELEKDDPRPLWCGIWGGPVVLSQACYDIWNSGRTEARKIELLNKIRVWDVLTQDASYFYVEQYLSQYVHWCKSDTSWIGMYKRDFPGAPNSNCDLSWANANIVNNHSALGTKYPASASGPSGVKEGDTPSYTFLIPNGLNPDFVEDWGSWGGQFKRSGGQSAKSGFGNSGAGPTRWTDEENALLARGENWIKRLTAVARWRDDMNRDFAARMDWCVMNKSGANHNPVAAFNGDKSLNVVYLNASAGQTVQLSALGSSDPDGNTISYRWTHYFEAEKSSGKGLYNNGSAISISNSTSMNASLTVPSSAAGKNIHVILEVADNGTLNMKSYRRIIIKVSISLPNP